jgi:pimeloyl-ACP methyl ester carboxylesterase
MAMEVLMSQASPSAGARNIVLVHGGFVDGSGWQGVYKALKEHGYSVTIVQNPTNSLADDVAVTRRALAAQNGPVILVGHSYGGVVITEAGNDPKVAGLVYVAAFAPEKGESVSALIKDPPPGAPVPPILPPQDGYLFLDKAKFAASFAADVSRSGRVHGRFPGSMGGGGAQRHHQPTGVEDEAKLVPGRHRGQDDPARRPARDVQTRRRNSRRGKGQPRCVRVAAERCGLSHRKGREGRGGVNEIDRSPPPSRA